MICEVVHEDPPSWGFIDQEATSVEKLVENLTWSCGVTKTTHDVYEESAGINNRYKW